MPTYQYEAMDNTGLEIKETIDASSETEAQQLIKDKGFFVTRIQEQGRTKKTEDTGKKRRAAARRKGKTFSIGGVRSKQLCTFTRQLSTLQDAGLPVLRSLRILEGQSKPGPLKNSLITVIEDIESGLKALIEELRVRKIRSVAVPPLGSGLGGLDWERVRPLIEEALGSLPEVDVIVFEPGGTAATVRARSKSVPKMTAGRAALLSLMKRYLAAMMDTSISLLEIHKLMYFLQYSGEQLQLRYVKALLYSSSV